ncbi:MAG: protein kinase domain-containing protein [Gemmatimonadaceae bacterium]
MTPPNDWLELETLVDQVLDVAPEQRSALIERLSGGDAERRSALQRLVAECERDHPFLNSPAAERFSALLNDPATTLPEQLAGRYRITRELGRGGMAIVYLAEDVKHHRQVAVKIVRPELAAALGHERFLREIEIAAKLHHPHIVSLYDSGEAGALLYYVMPYEEGLSLRQKLVRDAQIPIPDAVRILRDVADALAYAHEHGVVHRDIKPENVMLSGRHAMVTDFGVAKAFSDATDQRALTTAGMALGTPAYMAPEQIVADPLVDHRADIYAFGAMAYELLAGRPPFVRPSIQGVLGAHMTELAEPVSRHRDALPAPLAALVMRCLEKKPADRWQSADDILHAIEALPAPTPAPGAARRPRWKSQAAIAAAALLAITALSAVWIRQLGDSAGTIQQSAGTLGKEAQQSKTIAVLPFENLGPADNDYFAAGMTDEITSRLGAVSGLALVSRRAAQRYAGSDLTMQEVGGKLGSDYLLTGLVRWTGSDSSRVRITLELLSAKDEKQIWTENYDRVIDDIFEVQSDIAGKVSEKLGVTLLERERTRLTAEPTTNHEAYKLYLKGRHFWNKRTEENLQIALGYFQQAVDLDPSYSLAWAGIADAWISRGWYGRLAPRETYPKAKHAAIKALELDSTLADAQLSLAHIQFQFDHDWDAAERGYRKALVLNPKHPVAHHWYGGFLTTKGQHKEALEQAEIARALDPLSPIIQTWVGLRYYFAARHAAAIEEHLKALDLDSSFAPAHWHLGWAYEQIRRFDQGISEAKRAFAIDSGSLVYLASLGHAYAKAGKHNEARETLARLARESQKRHVSAYHVGVIHFALGDEAAGLEWLERALEERSPWIGYLNVDPRVDLVRSHPRFERLLTKARLRQ